MRVDLHVHTRHSRDSLITEQDVIRWVARRGLDALAITDHNTIVGALALADMAPFQVIVGEEIMSSEGEIIGLFLEKEIPPFLTPQETVARIRQQGGIVYIPHPVDRVRESSLSYVALMSIVDQVDALEVLNARVTFATDNELAAEIAEAHHLLAGAGSDAHQGFEIGHAHMEMAPFHNADEFRIALRDGSIRGRISSPLVHVGSTYAKVAKGLRVRPPFAN